MINQIFLSRLEKSRENYFDELIRIPDYVAGALASYDIENKENMFKIKGKNKLIFRDVISESINQVTLKLESSEQALLSVYNFKWMNSKST